MDKKKWIFWAVAAAAVAALFLFVNFAPSFTCGAVIGWLAKCVYSKYIEQPR